MDIVYHEQRPPIEGRVRGPNSRRDDRLLHRDTFVDAHSTTRAACLLVALLLSCVQVGCTTADGSSNGALENLVVSLGPVIVGIAQGVVGAVASFIQPLLTAGG